MARHTIGTRDEWLSARLDLLAAEKELTRRSDELARRRQELPWVRIDKEYRFETDEGSASLADLFRGRSQLLVYHFMFGPDYAAGCPSCSSIADGFAGFAVHLANHDVMLWAASRAPLDKLQAYKQRMGWSFPWASSNDIDFNFDFDVSFTEEQQRSGFDYNFREQPPKPPADPGDPARLERAGPLIAQNHCNICHRPDFSGQNNVPRLADQREDYLLKTLRDYKSGARHGYEPTMAEVLQPVEDAQLVELAYYLSHLR